MYTELMDNQVKNCFDLQKCRSLDMNKQSSPELTSIILIGIIGVDALKKYLFVVTSETTLKWLVEATNAFPPFKAKLEVARRAAMEVMREIIFNYECDGWAWDSWLLVVLGAESRTQKGGRRYREIFNGFLTRKNRRSLFSCLLLPPWRRLPSIFQHSTCQSLTS